MEIIAKSIIEKAHLDAKVKDGTNKIEIQLIGNFYDNDVTINKLFNETLKSDVIIYNVHTPLVSKTEFNLEYFSQPEFNRIFLKCCELSQKYAEYYKHNINVIVHNAFTLPMYKSIPILLNEIIKLFEEVINNYPNIIISIENVLPFSFGDKFCGRAGFITENVEVASYLNEVCSKPIFRTTLDTCHLLTTLKYFEMFKDEPKYNMKSIDLEYFFNANKNTINNIHLCNVQNFGMGYHEHGTEFDITKNLNDFKFLEKFISLYNKYNYNALITIEVYEDNYFDCVNFRTTRESLKAVAKKIPFNK